MDPVASVSKQQTTCKGAWEQNRMWCANDSKHTSRLKSAYQVASWQYYKGHLSPLTSSKIYGQTEQGVQKKKKRKQMPAGYRMILQWQSFFVILLQERWTLKRKESGLKHLWNMLLSLTLRVKVQNKINCVHWCSNFRTAAILSSMYMAEQQHKSLIPGCLGKTWPGTTNEN